MTQDDINQNKVEWKIILEQFDFNYSCTLPHDEIYTLSQFYAI